MTAEEISDTWELTAAGRLKRLSEWGKSAAEWLAKREGLVLTGLHWEIILLMRDYYREYNISPIKKLLKKEISEKLGARKASDVYLDTLFPNGVLVQGTRIAGLPIPMLDAEVEQMHSTPAKPALLAEAAPRPIQEAFEFNGKTYQVHGKGNLANPDEWNESLAEFMATREGLKLSPEHWEVIQFLRQFYFRYGITPMVRLLMKHMKEELGPEKASAEYLYQLFPGGPSRQGSRIAGLPEPQGCID